MIELLAVIAVIAVLIAILLPAVHAAREAARKTRCTNNLRQLGLAIHNYYEVNSILPPGAFISPDDFSDPKRGGSILIRLLPYLDQQPVFDLFDFDFTPALQTIPGTSELIGSTVIATFRCPSDPFPNFSPDHPEKFAVHNYAASQGPTWMNPGNPACLCSHPFNVFGRGGEVTIDQPGVFNRRSVCTKFKQITDGLSNTIFMGEVLPQCSAHNDSGWVISNNGQGFTKTTIPINYDSCDRSSPVAGTDNCGRYCNWTTEKGFKSVHSGGAYFLFGDGRVRFLNESIDHEMYQDLGDKSDGHATQLSP